VVWITGRVDTIPAVFFLGSFLAYALWRRGDAKSTRLYLCSIVLFFCALFSKQNTIVMVATLFLYDLVAERRPTRASWSWLAPYAPFAVLTIAYLLLRYLLFGEVVREGQLTAVALGLSRIFVGKHFQRMFVGGEVARYSRRLYRRAAGDGRRLVPRAFCWRCERAPRTGHGSVFRPMLVVSRPHSSRGRGL
jgi:hypothetical protein